MRYIKGLLLAWVAVMTLGMANIAMAQSTAPSDAQAKSYLNEILAIEYRDTDLAHASFGRLFGTFIFKPFGGVEQSTSPTVLAHVLGYTNVIAMILGCVIMGYVILGGAVNTAASGELLGRSWSSVWLPMRTTIAFGAIMPASDGESVFSVAQSLVIWMVILGSNSGTWIWEKGAAELKVGGAVISGTSFYDAEQYRKVVEVMNCAVARRNMYIDVGDSDEVANGIGMASSPSGLKQVNITANGITNLPGDFSKVDFYDCGTITSPLNTSANRSEGEATDNAATSAGESFWFSRTPTEWERKVVSDFRTKVKTALPIYLNATASTIHSLHSSGFSAKSIDAVLTETAEKRGDKGKAIIKELNEMAIAYRSLEDSYTKYYGDVSKSISENKAAQKYFEDQLKTGGWMRAGAWFFEASRFQGLSMTLMSEVGNVGALSSNKGVGLVCNFSENAPGIFFAHKYVAKKLGGCEEKMQKLAEHLALLPAVEKYAQKHGVKSSGAISSTIGKAVKISGKTETGDIDPKVINTLAMSGGQIVMNALAWLGCDNATGGGNVTKCTAMTTDTSGMTSPFTMLSSIGHGLIQLSTTMWWICLGFVAVAGGVGGSVLSLAGGGAVSAATYYIVASVTAALGGFIAMGFMFAYVLPFMPVMAWIMIIIGYLITVVEAVAAAPLAVIMMATPEGEGLSGANMQRAIQLINAIILKPSLAIVGLFAAMTMGYVAFALINNLFWTVASMQNSGAMIGFLATMSIYTALCYKCVQAMIDIMHRIPNDILEWMAGGVSREFGSNISESINGMRGVGQGVGEVGAASAGSKVLNALQREKMARGNDDDKDKGGDKSPSPKGGTN